MTSRQRRRNRQVFGTRARGVGRQRRRRDVPLGGGKVEFGLGLKSRQGRRMSEVWVRAGYARMSDRRARLGAVVRDSFVPEDAGMRIAEAPAGCRDL